MKTYIKHIKTYIYIYINIKAYKTTYIYIYIYMLYIHRNRCTVLADQDLSIYVLQSRITHDQLDKRAMIFICFIYVFLYGLNWFYMFYICFLQALYMCLNVLYVFLYVCIRFYRFYIGLYRFCICFSYGFDIVEACLNDAFVSVCDGN